MAEHDSCLITKLSHYCELDEDSHKYLRWLEEDEEIFEKNAEIRVAGSSSFRLFVIKKGWLYSYIDLPDGRRQIVKIHHPGDIVGFSDIALKSAATTLRTAERVNLCPFPQQKLDRIFSESPRLTALLFTLAVRDQVTLIDTIKALGRMSAREKLAYFLLEIDARIQITKPSHDRRFRMPLSQTEIGDSIGLTNVYVSRTLNSLESDGYIRREGQDIMLLKHNALAEMVDFDDRYQRFDTSWFPQK
jgi:CRP-like cAMP-binding protein